MEHLGLEYLNENPIINVLFIKRFFNSEIIYESQDGVILKDKDFYYISFRNKEVAEEILKNYKIDAYYTVNKFVADIIKLNVNEYYQFNYLSKDKKNIKDDNIRKLDVTYLEIICQNYTLLTREDIKEHLENGDIYGLFVDNKLAGFIGRHTEGSIGMLHVLNEYRHKGYAYILEGYMINKDLMNNEMPYCHVALDNDASIHLQSKLGMVKLSTNVYWCFK